ncbi:MAG: ANTAR domain-containing protein [Rhodobacterales bacterium]|nr:ANTAR domain-containing protein [Rhodobacterales bacterium]
MKILVLDESETRAEILLSGLRDAGYHDLHHLADTTHLVENIARIAADAILIDFESPSRDSLEQLFRVTREIRRPIALFVDESDPEMTRAAIRAGVSAYIVNGLSRERVKPVMEVAISRFQAFSELEERAHTAEAKLEERKTIERAKAILMARRNMTEAQAHDAIRRMAREKGKRMAEVAESLLNVSDMVI